ncbi:hypothetical protein KR009_010505 [Drosophila setifemur]|nr:hypothetical protein KR009_010505 [Drosophila setifemur]
MALSLSQIFQMTTTKEFCRIVRLKSTQAFIIAGTVLITIFVTLLCIGFMTRYEVEHEVANLADVDYWKDRVSSVQKIWYDKGIAELNEALITQRGPIYPRNVRIFLVQGIDGPDLAAYRFPVGAGNVESSNFAWDNFPHMARLKNSCSQRSPCQVGSVSRALWSGIPLDISFGLESDCWSVENQTGTFLSVLRQAQLAGLRTGFVTTQRITGHTGAALYGYGNYECDERMPLGSIQSGCQDIARQLISGQSGRSLNVIMGGGRQMLNSLVPKTKWDPVDELLCQSSDGRNLLKEWRKQKLRESKISPIRFDIVQRTDELESLNASNFDYLMGVMANGDLSGNFRAPNLNLMVERSLEVLKKKDQGYFLVVEQFIHSGMEKRKQLLLLNETLFNLPKEHDTLTLVLITNAIYPNPRLDVSEETETISHLPETFGGDETQIQQRINQMPSDSFLFAQGPKSSLFYGVRPETFLAHSIAHVLSKAIGKAETEPNVIV